jgi:hypothetical protein
MIDRLSLLDEALALGDKEQQLLTAGQYEELGRVSKNRSRLVVEALEGDGPLDLNLFRDKLLLLSSLQGRLTEQAKQLHESVRLELLRTKKEGERMSGYARGRKVKSPICARIRKKG